MGFGIALIGYGFLLLHELGGSFIGSIVLAYGFFLASRLNRRFLSASISALVMLPRGIVQICSMFFEINLTVNTVSFLVYLAAWMFMSYFWLSAVIEIARDNDAARLERGARYRLIITVLFLTAAAVASVLNVTGMLGEIGFMVASAQYIVQYIVIFINLFFLHNCFILITSERQYERDKQQIASERAKALEKREKERREARRKD